MSNRGPLPPWKSGDQLSAADLNRLADMVAQRVVGGPGLEVRAVGRTLALRLTKRHPIPSLRATAFAMWTRASNPAGAIALPSNGAEQALDFESDAEVENLGGGFQIAGGVIEVLAPAAGALVRWYAGVSVVDGASLDPEPAPYLVARFRSDPGPFSISSGLRVAGVGQTWQGVSRDIQEFGDTVSHAHGRSGGTSERRWLSFSSPPMRMALGDKVSIGVAQRNAGGHSQYVTDDQDTWIAAEVVG